MNTEQVEATEEELTYQDMYATIILSEEITFVIPSEDIERTKTGIKNCKARQTSKDKADGLPVDNRELLFTNKESTEYPGATELTISFKKSGIRVFATKVPEKF